MVYHIGAIEVLAQKTAAMHTGLAAIASTWSLTNGPHESIQIYSQTFHSFPPRLPFPAEFDKWAMISLGRKGWKK